MNIAKTGLEPQLGPAIRKRRKQMSMTLQALSDRAGISVGYLSQVERDNATPTLGTLAQIADALGVGLEYFIAASRPADGLTRAGERALFALAGSSLTYETLTADLPGSEMSSYVLHIPPGYASETVSHEGEEIIYLLEGEIDQTLGGQSFRLRPGDSLHYNGTTPHAWTNTTSEPTRILWTGTLRVLHRKGAVEMPILSRATKKSANKVR